MNFQYCKYILSYIILLLNSKFKPGYRFNTILTIFNLFDTIGRFSPNYFKISLSFYEKLVFSRFLLFIFVGVILVLYKFLDMSITLVSIFGIIINSLLGFSNGYLTSITFMNAPNYVETKLKGKASSSISLFLLLGIFIGTLFAASVCQNLI